MAPSSKVAKACKAMKDIGIPEESVKPVLKHLLNLYDKNWKLIEDENYRVLIDAIFEGEHPQRQERRKHQSLTEDEPEECQPPLKRTRMTSHLDQVLASPGNSSQDKEYKREIVSSSEHCRGKDKIPSSSQGGSLSGPTRPSSEHLSTPTHVRDNEEAPAPCQFSRRRKTLKYEQGTHSIDESDGDDLPQFEVPLAVALPAWYSSNDFAHEDGLKNQSASNGEDDDLEFLGANHICTEVVAAPPLLCEDGPSHENCSSLQGNGLELLEYKHLDTEKEVDGASDLSQFDIASSQDGDVKISLIFNCSKQSDFCIPSLDAVLKSVEEKYLKTYRITEPGFSLVNIMKDVCECFLAEGTNRPNNGQEKSLSVTPSLALSKRPTSQDLCIPSKFSNEQFVFRNLVEVRSQLPRVLNLNKLDVLNCIKGLNAKGYSSGGRDKKTKAREGLGSSSLKALVVVKKHSSCNDPLKALLYIDDITRGEEEAKISLVNDISDESPPPFYYIPRNIVYQNAYVKFLLARICDENCCSNCFGDCTSLAVPCACAGETGGEFAYTPGGVVEEKFLEKCISMSRGPEQHHFFYCQDCPLERSKDKKLSGDCKGHLVRKFIKECWYKCGCSKQCGNRLVQRGITVNLQVFMTPEGKGWGLRTLEDLPKGAFICEYVGEIVTNMELYERTIQMSGRERHTYPVLLDADWGSEGVLKDEEALCLDATNYGNVARFINHRCSDANLMEIPVEVETPDHHYYHLAFFTTRKVDAFEEFTWDYGIDFEDHSHPVKAFQCRCGSKFCGDVKRRKGARTSS